MLTTSAIIVFCVAAGILVAQALAALTRKTSTRGTSIKRRQRLLAHTDRSKLLVFGACGLSGATVGFVVFGTFLMALCGAIAASTWYIVNQRTQRRRRMQSALEAWPSLIEQIRLRTNAQGMSLPVALFVVGRTAPIELRAAFADAEAEWQRSTDFSSSTAILASRLGDSTSAIVVDTLTIAHSVGGTDIDTRLSDLARDRAQDVAHRMDARAKQAGVRFARRFVLIVPIGLAAVGASIGTGRAAYATSTGNLWSIIGVGCLAACWIWSGRLLRMPGEVV
jgi:tight adherence protein B